MRCFTVLVGLLEFFSITSTLKGHYSKGCTGRNITTARMYQRTNKATSTLKTRFLDALVSVSFVLEMTPVCKLLSNSSYSLPFPFTVEFHDLKFFAWILMIPPP